MLNAMILLFIFSLIKKQPISTCLVLSCWTGLLAMLIADLLSQYNLEGPFIITFNSNKMFLANA
jgi:hypothetical protein